MSDPIKKTSPALVAAAWVIVALPLSWGLYQSVIKTKPLFTSPPAPPAQTAPVK